MKEYRYPTNRILADYFLGGAGTLMSVGLIILASSAVYIDVICGGLTAVFLLFTIRTAFRHRMRILADAEGLTVKGGPVRQMKWQELDGLTLRYYSARRNRKDGWMTLGLKSRGRSLAIDSHIEGFETLARLAADAAAARNLDLDPTTRSNFAALEVTLPPPVGALEVRAMKDLLSVEDLAISFNVHGGKVDAVRGVSFRVPVGGSVAIVGESGSGKSVVSQAIMGILPPAAIIRSGKILFSDPAAKGRTIDIAALPQDAPDMRAIRGGRISIIFQEPMTSLSPIHTIGDQIGEALHLHRKVDAATGRELVIEMLRLVGFPNPAKAPSTYPFELSGGLRQRAMIAMALICRPALLIADEPTTALDVTIQAQILKLIKDLQSELGMALLIITHDLGVVANMASEVVVMYHGKVMESGTLDDIFRHPTHPYLQALLRAVPRFHMAQGERLTPLREIPPPSGRMIAAPPPWPVGADAAGPLLKVSGITKRFRVRNAGGPAGTIVAVDDVSFEIKRGECLGLVGESGCGKTTLSKVIMRALTPDSGKILFNDHGKTVDVLDLKGEALTKFRRHIQFIFQDPFGSLNPRMTVYDILSEPLVIHGIGTSAERKEVVKELMSLVGLNAQFLKRYPHSFSGGQRQRIGIARALALKPDLLLCDEPVSALDVSIQAQVLNLLKDLQAKLGLTYLFVSHNLAVVDYIADRIMVMCAGRIVEVAPSGVLFRNPLHPYTKALLTAVPEPNPDYRLAFDKLMEGKASQPAAWPAPFTVNETERPGLIDVGDGHFVRAAKALLAA